jgi:hypothetical protein
MFGIEKDFQQLMEQVYGPLGEKQQMTELEEVKAQLKVLEKKVALLEEIEKTPIPQMELLKDGRVFCVEYNETIYYRQEYHDSDGWIKWWRQDDEDTSILTRVDDAETFRLLEKVFSADLAANPDGSLKFIFGPKLYDVILDWWDDIFSVNSNDDSNTSIRDLVRRIEEWLPKPQSAAGSQSIGVEELVQGFNDAINKIKSKLR